VLLLDRQLLRGFTALTANVLSHHEMLPEVCSPFELVTSRHIVGLVGPGTAC
jgi:hypothetical protein